MLGVVFDRRMLETAGLRSSRIFHLFCRSRSSHCHDTVVLPAHLRTLARVDGEVTLDITGEVTRRSVLDALEARYPMLRGTIRDHATFERRAFVRFFASKQDLSHEATNAKLPMQSQMGINRF